MTPAQFQDSAAAALALCEAATRKLKRDERGAAPFAVVLLVLLAVGIWHWVAR